MKKLILPLVLLFALALSACAGNSPAQQPSATVGPKQSENASIVDGSGYNGDTNAYSYVSPKPGKTLFFDDVRAAIEELRGTDARLFVAIDIFDAEGQLADNSDALIRETERLASLGYEIGRYEAWTYQGEGERLPYTFLYGVFSAGELESFAASEVYGYAFRFAYNGDGSAVRYTGAGDVIVKPQSKGA